MNRTLFLFINFLILSLLLPSIYSCSEEEREELASPSLEKEYQIEVGEIGKGDFFMPLLTSKGASYNRVDSLLSTCDSIFDPRRIKVGDPYKAYYLVDTLTNERELALFEYQPNRREVITFSLLDSCYVERSEKEVTPKLKYGSATIESSLWLDLEAVGMRPILALKISDIYAWTVDFFALRKGDSFNVLYEELYIGDQFYDIGEIYLVEFTHQGQFLEAYRFEQDESVQYWNLKGENLQKAFLKAPLNFTRISSGFSYARRHPVTRVVRPHTGVDYAAPTGTPVVSIGDGVVTMRGWGGGGGNTVKIKHNSVYTTAYLHLSRYAKGLRVGKRVKQGEVIGYVGMTGTATGPHLDFRVWKNGTPINPLTMESPPATPIKEENREAFELSVTENRQRRDSLLVTTHLVDLLETVGVTVK